MRIKKTKNKKISRGAKVVAVLLLMPWTLVGAASAYMFAPDTGSVVPVGDKMAAIEGGASAIQALPTDVSEEEKANIYFFGRDGCGHCGAEKDFLDEYLKSEPNVRLTYYDVVKDDRAGELFVLLTEANELPKVVPYTFVGGEIFRGFGGRDTTGQDIIEAVERAKNGFNYDIEAYLNPEDIVNNSNGNTEQATSSEGVLYDGYSKVEIPIIGEVDLKNFSLFSLSAILGLIDGFNPCALWVLMAFLLILMQIGNRKKMFYVAGLFIFSESIMYYLILNVWYQTWDFIALDRIITPLVGAFAIGCGVYFLHKYKKTKDKLVCDVTSLEKQSKIQKKIHKLINSPMTLATIVGIIGVALSVNVIEFACSVGIPQAFTKILELNSLDMWTRQWYTFLYILAYMIDDFIVFGFALYGFDKLHTSEKYSKLSILIGGILMILLGGLLLFFPNVLIF